MLSKKASVGEAVSVAKERISALEAAPLHLTPRYIYVYGDVVFDRYR